VKALRQQLKKPAVAPEPASYVQPDALAPLPAGQASLYRTPWRANLRVASGAAALDGIGVYYKHVPNEWTEVQNVQIMKEMAAAGIRRARIAPHHTIYIHKDWTKPTDQELVILRNHLRAAKAAGIRPCVTFVHIPPIGKPGTRELQDWWRQGELLPAGDVGSPEFKAYQDKTYEALKFVLDEAKAAGFTAPGSYDLEMGQGLWWGAPSVPRPLPSTGLEALRPGGRVYEFDRGLAQRLRRDGYQEPTLLWCQTYHHFENCRDDEVPAECVGRAVSFYSAWTGISTDTWLTQDLFGGKRMGPNDVWPVRPPLAFAEAGTPRLVLAKPEGWMADRSRHDNLIELLKASKTPVAVTSLGTVPGEIPEFDASPYDGWDLKSRGLTRSLAFWLNQGATMVLLHSAFEPGQPLGGELAHSLIPGWIDPARFAWQQAPPLVTLRAFADGLRGAQPLKETTPLNFRYRWLAPDVNLVPASGGRPALRASDALAILPFQLTERGYAVAIYVVTPNIAVPLRAQRLRLVIDRPLVPASLTLSRPVTGFTGVPALEARDAGSTTLCFDIHDDVTWLRFEIEPQPGK